MKNNLTLVLLLMGMSATIHMSAQTYVKTYNSVINGIYNPTRVVDIVDATNGPNAFTCTLENQRSTIGGPSSIILKKFDKYGNLMFDVSYTPATGTATPTSVIHTLNDEYIVVGYFSTSTLGVTNNPFAARFDNSGNLLWHNYYRTGTGSRLGRSSKVVIARVEDDPAVPESYIIAASTEDMSLNIGINAVRIDGSGSTLWNYIYTPAITGYTYDVNVSAIVFGKAGGPTGKYLIAGEVDQFPIMALRYKNCHMAIDNTGAVINNYEEAYVPTYPFATSAIYDYSINNFVLAYTQGDNNLVGLPTASEPAITKLDYASLGHIQTDYYWISGMVENYCSGICENQAKTSYLLSGVTFSSSTPGGGGPHMTLFQIPKGVGTKFAHQYNTGTNSYTSTGIFSTMDYSGAPTESHVMAGDGVYSVTGTGGLRVINANAMDEACGSVYQQVNSNSFVPPPTVIWPTLSTAVTIGEDMVPTVKDMVMTNFTDCALAPSSSTYKAIGFMNPTTSTEQLNIYPTFLSKDDNSINIKVFMNHESMLTISLYNVEGKKMGTQIFNLKAGGNSVSWTLPFLTPGNYLISTVSENSNLIKTTRISKL
jgi:hypothetical protein